jgi:hypothetical protein
MKNKIKFLLAVSALLFCSLNIKQAAAQEFKMYTPGEFYANLTVSGWDFGTGMSTKLSLDAPFFSGAEGYTSGSGGMYITDADREVGADCNYSFIIVGPGITAPGTFDISVEKVGATKSLAITIIKCSTGTETIFGCKSGALVISRVDTKALGSFKGEFEEIKDSKFTGNKISVDCTDFVIEYKN